MNHWTLVQHVAFEGRGLIAEVASEHGSTLDVHRIDLGDPLPEPDDVNGLVAMGGPSSSRCVARGLAVLGARVRRGSSTEVGFGTVILTDGKGGHLGCSGRRGSTRFQRPLPHQAFRLGQQVCGLQFHVEVTPGMLDELRPDLPSGTKLDYQDDAAVDRGSPPPRCWRGRRTPSAGNRCVR